MKGYISISKVHNCKTNDEYISIAIEDESSSIEFVTATMSLKDFTKALTGQGHIPIAYALRGVDKVGKEYQHKTEIVPFLFDASEEDINKAVGRYEVDGWIGTKDDYKNHHNQTGPKGVRIVYYRWVEKEKADA